MKKRTTSLLGELKTLAKDAGANVYRRIALASEVLADLDWIAQHHDGSDLKAMDAIQDDYFRDIRGLITLGELLAIYRQFPGESAWREYRYDLAAMRILHREATAEEKPERKYTSYKTKSEEIEKKLEVVQRLADSQQSELSALRDEMSKLREENARLREENARLRGRIEELTRTRAA